ncbi:UNVERIFIED_CONTAM: Auxin-induced protein 15A [Sesamum latifolium]|uniref:Auxin-induced protein 15A n=1 Tax=Sesamum latifolium TaxID=2727402 RepID=A0AAW2VCP6_9LAMI
MPSDVPRGYLAVYVGPELRRFIIPTSYLSDPLFKVLLEKVEEEFGFDHSGGLTIPCDIETFKYLLQCMENHRKEQADQGTAAFSVFFSVYAFILVRRHLAATSEPDVYDPQSTLGHKMIFDLLVKLPNLSLDVETGDCSSKLISTR